MFKEPLGPQETAFDFTGDKYLCGPVAHFLLSLDYIYHPSNTVALYSLLYSYIPNKQLSWVLEPTFF